MGAQFSSMKRRFSTTLDVRKFVTLKIELGLFVLYHDIHIISAHLFIDLFKNHMIISVNYAEYGYFRTNPCNK